MSGQEEKEISQNHTESQLRSELKKIYTSMSEVDKAWFRCELEKTLLVDDFVKPR